MTGAAAALLGPTLLDGGLGTALLARGLPPDALPEEWILSRPEEIAAVHAEHAAAGARVLLTNTFNLASPRLEARVDPALLAALAAGATRLARRAAAGGLVAGALGPTGLPSTPRATLAARYGRAARALAAAGVDLLWLETQHDLAEALAALEAARRAGLPVALTFTFRDDGGRLSAPDGTAGADCLAAAEAGGAAATGVNCVFPGPSLDQLARLALGRVRIPLVVKASPGLPGAVLPPAAFAEAMRGPIAAGVRVVGGCCGASGDHLRTLAAVLARAR